MKKHKLRYAAIFTVAIVTGTMLMQTSQDVQRAEEQLAAIEIKVGSEKESIRVLRTEWDYLNNPERLEALAKQYLDIDAPKATQILSTPADLPDPFAPVLPQAQPASVPAPQPAVPMATSISYTPSEKSPDNFNALLNKVQQGGAQ